MGGLLKRRLLTEFYLLVPSTCIWILGVTEGLRICPIMFCPQIFIVSSLWQWHICQEKNTPLNSSLLDYFDKGQQNALHLWVKLKGRVSLKGWKRDNCFFIKPQFVVNLTKMQCILQGGIWRTGKALTWTTYPLSVFPILYLFHDILISLVENGITVPYMQFPGHQLMIQVYPWSWHFDI